MIPEHLSIEFDGNVKSNLEKKKVAAKVLKTSCQNIGKSVQAGSGPWGFGVFKNYSCSHGAKKIFGNKKKSPWSMNITNSNKNFIFQIKNNSEIVAETKLKGSESGFDTLQDPEFVDLIAYSLMLQLPFLIKIDHSKINKADQTVKFRHWKTSETAEFKFKFPKPPQKIRFYTLQQDPVSKLYKSHLIGEGQLSKTEPPKLESPKGDKKKSQKKKDKDKVLKGGFVYYSVPQEVLNLNDTLSLWAHLYDGPVEKDPQHEKIMNAASSELDKHALDGTLDNFLKGKTGLIASLLESAASGYVGMRYGLQVLPVEGQLGKLLDDTSIFNLVAEVRGGPVKGLRYYYDKLPETKMKLDGVNGEKVKTSVAFARHVLGFSWEIPIDFVVDRITIDPKLGVWTFNASLPVQQDEFGNVLSVQDFNLGSTASVAIESGIEISKDWFTLRGFYAFDGGFSLVKQGGKVTSNRFGGEAFFKAGPKFTLFDMDFKTAILGSFVYEAVTISKGVGELEAGQSEISAISYSAGYAGGGGAISW